MISDNNPTSPDYLKPSQGPSQRIQAHKYADQVANNTSEDKPNAHPSSQEVVTHPSPNKLQLSHVIALAAPQTWPASILPALLAFTLIHIAGYDLNLVLALPILAGVILLQCSVNTFNDYADVKRGVDTLENCPDTYEATLLTSNIKPKQVKALAFFELAVAGACSIYPLIMGGIIPFIIALIAAVVVLTYSLGKIPLSYLPLGELVSSLVMGLCIPMAAVSCLISQNHILPQFYAFIALASLPLIAGIASIMLTNNTCDIEKDLKVKRRTLPTYLGRKKSRQLHFSFIVFMLASIMVNALTINPSSGIIGLFGLAGLLLMLPLLTRLKNNPFTLQNRPQAMSLTVSLVTVANLIYLLLLAL